MVKDGAAVGRAAVIQPGGVRVTAGRMTAGRVAAGPVTVAPGIPAVRRLPRTGPGAPPMTRGTRTRPGTCTLAGEDPTSAPQPTRANTTPPVRRTGRAEIRR